MVTTGNVQDDGKTLVIWLHLAGIAILTFGTSAVETRSFGPPIWDEKPKPTSTIGPSR